ncbi:hypothetical protein N7537_012018 [Penicillium hordei]|uniref:Heterokaryon incompatibility domain-containing protein n=1 Tax=Penicillium hordei TaxID=40994 RepID=A0AAD6DMX9_9EURO|nr:uncharacterized protein N7537_012018 [Penicillium hordei]KAJ5589340.1 hypothetical protein N7537_012018 [Penicillium hordei]
MSEDDEHPLQEELNNAASLGDLECMKTLLSTTDVNINGGTGTPYRTALHEAVTNGRDQVVQLLLDWNAEIEVKDHSGSTPLHCAVKYNRSKNLIRMLLDHGANVNADNYRGSVLREACWRSYQEAIYLLLDYGADVNSPNQPRQSALQAATNYAHEDIVHMLLKKGAEVSFRSSDCESALMLAVNRVDTSKICLLLQYGAKIDGRILDMAVIRRHEKTLHTLLEASPSAFDVDCNYELALETIAAALKKTTPPALENNSFGCTVAQVRSVWEDGLGAYKYPWGEDFLVDRWRSGSPDERARIAHKFGIDLIKRASSPKSHFEKLNERISRGLLSGFQALPMKGELDDNDIINRACKLLSQLPSTSPPLFSIKLAQDTISSEVFDKYFFVDTRINSTPHWDDLRVTSLTSALVVQVALRVSWAEARQARGQDNPFLCTQGVAQIRLRESILSTIIFSDWNVRAWTFLEAMQSREKIMFLCKHNRIFSVRENVEIVMTEGSLDIGTAFLTTPHLLPQSLVELVQPTEEEEEEKNSWLDFFDKHDSRSDDEPEDNSTLETAAFCLQHRPASREGDAFIIWTILADAPTLRSPEDFWRSKKGTFLSTGFLMSEVSRLKTKGLSWAPSDPIACKIPSLLNGDSSQHREANMMPTEKGEIRDEGFSAFWQVFYLEPSARKNCESLSEDAAFAGDIGEAVRSHFSTRNKIALLRPALQTTWRASGGKIVADIKRLALPIVAVCEYCPDDNGWKWLGVRTLDPDGYLPDFLYENILLV